MIGKLIVYGIDRESCIRRLKRALEEFVVDGMKTTVPLHQKIIADEAFLSGDYTIKWLERWLDEAKVPEAAE
jgi:acetyl-CoA carboxylase biotin carboxylase subunit